MEQGAPQINKVGQIILAILTLLTSLALAALCLFIMVLFYHDYQTARDWVVFGGAIPEDVFELGGIVLIVSMSVGFYFGAALWGTIFARLGIKIER